MFNCLLNQICHISASRRRAARLLYALFLLIMQIYIAYRRYVGIDDIESFLYKKTQNKLKCHRPFGNESQ